MKGRLKTKFVSLLLIVFILADMFSPYSILLNRSNATVDGLDQSQKYLFLRRTSDILTDTDSSNNEVRYFTLLVGLTGDYLPSVVDLEMKYNTSKLALINSSYKVLSGAEVATKIKVRQYMTEEMSDIYTTNYGSETLTSIDPSTGRITVNAATAEPYSPADPDFTDLLPDYGYEVPTGYNGFLPLYSIRFKILDSSITADTLTTDLISFNGNPRTPTGISIAYNDPDDAAAELQSLDYVLYDGFATSSDVKNIQTVSVKTLPTKVDYEHNDGIDLTGGKLEIEYTDGSKEEVDMTSTNFTLDKDTVAVGDTKVTGTYLGKYTIEFKITVTDPVVSVELTSQPTKQTYSQGETIELAGAVLTPTTKSGVVLSPISLPNTNVTVSETVADVNSENFEKTGTTTEGLDKGRQRITLTYKGISKQLDIMVNDTVKSIVVENAKINYEWGDELDKTQGSVKVNTTSGASLSSVPFTNGSVTISGYDKATSGKQTLTVTYLGKQTTYDVTVTDPVVSIVLDPVPAKTTYNPEEELDLTGSYVYEQRKSGTRINKAALTTDMISGYDNTKTGVQTLTVSYKNKTTTFDVTVLDTIKSIQVTGMQTEYAYGDALNIANAKVKPILYSGEEGTEVALTQAMIVSTFNSNKVGEQELTIQYDGLQTKITVNVSDVVKSISVKTEPQTRYSYGEELNVANGVITVQWMSGATSTEEAITSDMIREADGSQFNSNVTFPVGQTTVTKPLTIRYNGQTTTYNVTIVNEITGISIKTAPKTTYNVNDTLDVTGGEITIARQVGTEDKAIDASWVSNFDSTEAGRNKTLTVTYKENDVTKTTTYNINVIDQVKTIEVVSQPNKKEYGWGEELDLTGAQVKVTYGSGPQTINITRDMITNYDKESKGHQDLVVSFGGQTSAVTLDVTVVDKVVSAEMETYPQQEYPLNGSLNKNGEIKITRQSGATEKISLGAAGVTITGFDSSEEVKNQRLTVSYKETYSESSATVSTYYDINVIDKISSITVTTKPKTEYNYGELLSTTNGKVTVRKESGRTEEIDLDNCTVTGFDGKNLGKQILTVEYTKDGITKNCTYEVNVTDYVDKIEITSKPTKLNYAYGDTLDLTGGTITKTMASGEKSTVALSDAAVTIQNKDSLTLELGTRVVTVEYAGKTTSFTIEVTDEIESIVLVGTLKQTYKYGEPFDPNGAYLKVITKATSPNGYEKQITADMLSGFKSDELGTRQLTLKYLTFNQNYPYTINDYVEDIELTAPTKLRYTYTTNSEAKLDITGGSVRKIMASGEEVLPIGLQSEGVTYNEYVSDQLGSQIITVNYAGFSKTFEIVVRDELVSIELLEMPKQSYIYGDTFSTNGARVKIHYLSKSPIVSLTEDMVSDFFTTGANALTNGTPRTATVSFTYADGDDTPITKKATFTYTVEDQVEDIVLVEPTNKTYYYGLSDELDLTGGTVQKIMKSGITQEIVSLESIKSDVTGYISRPSTLGEQTITVSYAGKTKAFTIEVKDRLEGIAIVEGTPKANYYWGDTIELNGAKLSIDRLKNDETKTLTAEMIDGFTTTQLTAEGTTRQAVITIVEDGVEKKTSFNYTVSDYVSSITSIKKPSKLEYFLGDEETEFNISDAYLVISMASGTPASDIALTDGRVKVTGFDTSSTGTKAINVEFTNEKGEKLTTSFNIEVKDRLEKVTIEGTPKASYKWGENLELNGAKLVVSKLSGDTKIAITDDMITGFTTTQLTEAGSPRTATISYTFDGVTKTASFAYTVEDYIKDVALNMPSKTEYYLGEEIDLSDANLAITMASGNTTPNVALESDKVEVTGYDKDKLGTQTITVKYEGFVKTFNVEVKDRLENVSIKGTPKTAYKWGETLELNGAKLIVTKLSGDTEIAITEDMIDGFTTTKLTEDGTVREAKVSYTFDGVTKFDTFEYTVEDYIIGATLVAPSKVEYNYGTELKLSDAYLKISMASGNSAENVALTDSRVTITGYNKNKLGQQTVKVEYAGFEQTFGVVVVDKIKTVEFNINSIAKDYKYGENLDLSKATATIENLSGEKIPVNIDNSMISGYNPTKLGTQTVTIDVEGFTSTVQVNVVDYVVGIELTAPTKVLYIVKENLDLTGGSIKVTMASGATENKALANSMISGYTPTKLGAQTVKVTYEGFTKQFSVQVVDKLADISMEAMPKLQYKYGEDLDLTGAKLRVTNESDAYEIINITADMVKGYNPTKLGEQEITVTYEEKTTKFTVIVEDYVKEIEFTKPNKTEYKWGEELDLTGAKFTEILASGKVNKIVNVTTEMVTKFNNKVVGKQTLTAMYGDTPGEFQVSVTDDILSMAINNLPNKIEYLQGENIELAGGQITIIKDSGVYNFEITQDMISGFDPNALGTQIVTVKYQGFEAQLSVVVKEQVSEEPEEVVTKKPSKKPSKNNTTTSEENTEDDAIVNDIVSDEKTNANASENKDKENNNDVDKDVTLGIKGEAGKDGDVNGNVIVRTTTVSGLGIVALIALVFIVRKKNNVKIYEEDEEELILVGKEKLSADDKVLDISKYVQNAPEKNIIIVLDKNIAKKLDKETLKIKLENEELETVIDYEEGEFEIRIEK